MLLDYRNSHAVSKKVHISTTTWRLCEEKFNIKNTHS